jgi:hypothetical protein
MSEDATEREFKSAADRVDEAHKQAVADLRTKVEKAKSETLAKLKV